MTPIYVRAPEFAKPMLRWMIDHRMKRAATLLYLALIPINFTFVGKEGIITGLLMMRRALRPGRWTTETVLPPPVIATAEPEQKDSPREAALPVAVKLRSSAPGRDHDAIGS